jgi:hypothetical protein
VDCQIAKHVNSLHSDKGKLLSSCPCELGRIHLIPMTAVSLYQLNFRKQAGFKVIVNNCTEVQVAVSVILLPDRKEVDQN